jgi:preprotein translocase SecE subunit
MEARRVASAAPTNEEPEPMAWTTQTREFIKEVQVEFSKISWPSRGELRDSTLVTILTVVIVAAFIGVVDQLLNMLVHLLFR